MVTQYIVNFTDPEKTAFTVNPFTTDGPVAPNTLELSSTAVRANTSLLIYGKGHPDYGERIGEDFIHLMENFSGATEPKYPISGQTWFARITYAFVGLGSPTTANVYRWEDDSSYADGGRWIRLTNTGATDPTAADEVKTSGAAPTTVVDGAFWLDTVGSPLVPELYLGVNNTSSNMSATWLKREMEDLTGLVGDGGQFISQIGGSPELKNFLPQKQLKIYDGVQWKNAGNVYVNHVPPQAPSIGDLWYQTGVVGSPPTGSPTLGGNGGSLSQLFIWARPGPGAAPTWLPTGYVDRSGDTMTGTLSFGLPTSSLFIWEGAGDDTAGADIRATGNALLTSQENFYIHIDYDASDANAGNVVFEIASNSQTRTAGTFNRLFQVQSDGIIRSALPWGSPAGPLGSPNTYKNLLLTSNDDNALINKAYVDDVIATVGILENRVTINETNIEKLGGSPFGSPIYGKVNRIGDTMTGTLTFGTGTFLTGSPHLGQVAVDAGSYLISNLQNPISPEDAANKFYVDNAIFGSPTPFPDTYVIAATWDPDLQLLTLDRNDTGTVSVILNQSITTTGIVHTVTTPYLRDQLQETIFGSPLFGSPISAFPLQAVQSQINDTVIEDLNTRLASLELPLAREIFRVGVGSPLTVGGSPVQSSQIFTFTDDQYIAGTNRLMVFVNGVKQYANERARQSIKFNTGISGLTSTSQTLLAATPGAGSPYPNPPIPGAGSPLAAAGSPFLPINYTLDIAVDGGAAQRMSAKGNALIIFQDIVDNINTQITGVKAVWNFTNKSIDIYSDTTGTGSQINITDATLGSPLGVGVGSPSAYNLLGALATTPRPGAGSPLPGVGSPAGTPVYTAGNVLPAAGGPVSTVVRNLAYYEASTGSPSLAEATFGQITDTIVFNTGLQAADTVELLYEPVKE